MLHAGYYLAALVLKLLYDFLMPGGFTMPSC